MKSYNRHNFHKHTFCVFTEVSHELLPPGKPDYSSKSGSSYYFTETGVYRLSNHWGRAANCKWRLQPLPTNSKNRTRAGYANWKEFQSDNAMEKLYYIEFNPETETVSYNHKNNSKEKAEVFRTASETTKRIKQIRQLIKISDWEKHLVSGTSKHIIIQQLIDTEKSLPDIKKDFLR